MQHIFDVVRDIVIGAAVLLGMGLLLRVGSSALELVALRWLAVVSSEGCVSRLFLFVGRMWQLDSIAQTALDITYPPKRTSYDTMSGRPWVVQHDG